MNEFVKLNVRDTDTLCCSLLRQIPGGDISTPATWLAEKMLALLSENKSVFCCLLFDCLTLPPEFGCIPVLS